MNKKNAILRAIRFEGPEFIPVSFGFNGACWDSYDQNMLFDLIEAHPLLFPDYKRPKERYVPEHRNIAKANTPYTDDFGCLWHATVDGITGAVIKHPLDSWEKFSTYKFPDPEKCTGRGPINWEETSRKIETAKANGQITGGGLMHGHTFLNMSNIRGYDNLMYDFADEEPLVWKLIDGIENFHAEIIKRYTDMEVDIMDYPEDLGMQNGPMLSPEHFRKYIKPSYKRLVKIARNKGILIRMHSDGDVKTLVNDLIDGGIQVLNIQDLVNGIDWIKDNLKGRVCIDLDIDRQKIVPYGTPREIDNHIKEAVNKLHTREGGLMMTHGCYPGVPIENIKALMDAMERYAFNI
jgi:hypothetical protein